MNSMENDMKSTEYGTHLTLLVCFCFYQHIEHTHHNQVDAS